MRILNYNIMTSKTIVITGSTKGIGRGMALEFLKRNHQVIINGRNQKQLDALLDEWQKLGYQVVGVVGDVSDESTFQKLIDIAVAKFQKIDIWINNAGLPQSNKYFDELESYEIQKLVQVNISSVMLGTKMAIQFFKKQGYGQVFNMEGFGSDGRMMDKLTLYGSSKRAVQYFSKSISKEVKEEAIKVGILSPGMVRTDFLNHSLADASEEERIRNQKVFDILAEDVEVVTPFLVEKMLKSKKKYARIEFLTKRRLLPKIFKLMFVKTK